MNLDIETYEKLLSDEYPEHNFTISKNGEYKGNAEVYQVMIDNGEEDAEEFVFYMVVGYLGFSEERQKENFKRVVAEKFEAREKRLEKERKEREKEEKSKKK